MQFTGGKLHVEKLGAEEPPLMKEFGKPASKIARDILATCLTDREKEWFYDPTYQAQHSQSYGEPQSGRE
ncbi:hypothetical protein [Streptosporangium minutum]|uniref:Uncharacterized protein n=1 Tax=Streptosporangium minutum TaxID=569862 RepID=A0A243RIY5_9ACTN|nr:hypothetical protein [Streptosporangium minutum]OUC94838.1 hypothetical protein CA984_20910 [Streptosporangium minutum]